MRVTFDGPTATFTALRLAPRSRDGRAWVITAMPEPEPPPARSARWRPTLTPEQWDATARRIDADVAAVLARHSRPTGQADR